MGRYTTVYQDSLTNLQSGTLCNAEDINRYPTLGSSLGTTAQDIGASRELNICYFSETSSSSDQDFYNAFQFHAVAFSSLGSPTGVWQIDVSWPEFGGAWQAWDSGSFTTTVSTNQNVKVNSTFNASPFPFRFAGEFNTHTYFRLSIKVGFCTGQLILTGLRLYNDKYETFCPKDNQAHVLASSSVPSITNNFRNSSVGALGDGLPENLTNAVSGTTTGIAGVEPGLTCYIDCRRPVNIDKIVLMAHAKDTIEIGVAGSNDGLQFFNETILAVTTVRNVYSKYESTLSLGKYRYYRIYVKDKDSGEPSRQIGIADMRIYLDKGGANYQEIYYSRYALNKNRYK